MSTIIRSTKFWLLGAVVAAGLAGTAYATIPGGDGLIHGCYAKSGGTLRVIDASVTNCKSGETALNWNQQGQPGPQGPQGEPGPPGPQGEQGEPGAPGGLSGREVVSSQSEESSADLKVAQVSCPADKVPVGGGAHVSTQVAVPVALDFSDLSQSGAGWFARAHEVVPTDEPWLLTVSVICADAA
jgi:hypothetical protein